MLPPADRRVDTVRMRTWLALAGVVLLAACTGTLPAPPPTAALPAPSASPTPSPTASPRGVRPFERVQPVTLPADSGYLAVDRERIAYAEGTGITVLEVATGQRRTVFQATPGWGVALSSRALRGEVLVLLESRTDGQRTDARVIRLDLRANTRATLDDWSGPFLGGGDTWNPEPPVTNGTDAAWVRITDEQRPFAVDAVLWRGNALTVLRTGTSATWLDLHDDGRVAISTLINANDRAELVVWRAGQVSALGTRVSADGGPARFVGDRVFWALRPGIVARIERGHLIGDGGAAQDVDLGGCAFTGATARHLALACGTGTPSWTLLDPATGARGDAIPSALLVAGPRAAVWREGPAWTLGTLAP